MQFIEKLISSLILPPGIFILTLILLAVGVIYKQKYKFIGGTITLIAISMYITSIPVFANYLNKHINHVYQRQLPPKMQKLPLSLLHAVFLKTKMGDHFSLQYRQWRGCMLR